MNSLREHVKNRKRQALVRAANSTECVDRESTGVIIFDECLVISRSFYTQNSSRGESVKLDSITLERACHHHNNQRNYFLLSTLFRRQTRRK